MPSHARSRIVQAWLSLRILHARLMLDDRNLRFDLFALGLMAFTIFMGLSLLTYSPADPLSDAIYPLNEIYQPNPTVFPLNTELHNACGHAGAICADMLLNVLGLAAYYVVGCLFVVDVWLLMRRPIHGAPTRLVGWLVALVGGVTALQMFLPEMGFGPVIGPGGYIGAMGRTFLESHFATAGSLIILSCLIFGGLLLCTDYVLLQFAIMVSITLINMMPPLNLRQRIFGLMGRAYGMRGARALRDDEFEEEDEYEYEYEDESEAADSMKAFEISPEMISKRANGRIVSDLTDPLAVPDEETDEYDEEEWEEAEYEDEVDGDDELAAESDEAFDEDDALEDEAEEVAESTAATPVRGELVKAVSPKVQKQQEREAVMANLEKASREYDPQDYELPPIDLLNRSEHYDVDELTKEVKRKAGLLEKTFEDFNLDVKVVDIETGPVIAQYEVALKRGLRLSKITGLADDLAIALRVPSVRIVAPIPDKNTVGIEVPNDDRQVVRLREVMNETNGHMRKRAIPIFLGKDVSGNPLAVDLAKLPHLLIAGRTGTGKSVCLNAIISSILMTKTPDDVRMLMIDPKMVELSGYARLPHLMHPVVTDMRKAEAILAWACEKMDERYQLLARAGVRHVSSYNQLGEEELMERLKPETEDEKKLIPRHLPYIVIIADEMADLMMTAGKEVEAHIIRLSAKSRAVGIHLILATQKPTVDVITGLIKSNLPARLAFQVASKTDSRVVLDENGADKLLGYGDMLLLSPGTSTLLRGQGTFLSDDEIDRIVDYCGSKGEQNFVRELVQLKVEDADQGESREIKKRDELYEEAIGIVVREGRGSVSLLQRNLEIGYGRAARLIDFMAEDGIVGAYNGSKAREVLMTLSDWEASKMGGDARAATSAAPAPAPAPAAEPAPEPMLLKKEPAVEGEILQTKVSKIVAIPGNTDPPDETYDEEEYDEEEAELEDELQAELEDELEEAIDEEADEELEDEELDELDEEEAENEEDELEDEYEYEDEEADEYEDEYEYEDAEGELEEEAEDEEEDEADEELADEYDGEEFEQEDFDDEEFAAAVATQTGVDADEYEDVDDDFDALEAEAQEVSKIDSKEALAEANSKRRRQDDGDDSKLSPHNREKSSNKRVFVHRSHAE